MTILDAALLLAPVTVTDNDRACCDFVQHVIEKAYGLEPAPAGSELLGQWRLFRVDRPWSPVQAAVACGAAARFALPQDRPTPLAGWVHVVQGWRSGPDVNQDGKLDVGASGHCFFYFYAGSDLGFMVDSAIGRAPMFRQRSWSSIVAEFKAGFALAFLHEP